VRCGHCGNENSEANRFCGMCGAALVAKTGATESQVRATVAPGEKRAEPGSGGSSTEPRLPARSATEATPVISSPAITSPQAASPTIVSPTITGPSFLGLNTPADRRSVDSPSGHDQLPRSARNLDYLLEDEEEPPRGWGKLVMVVIALLLVGGFGYLRWKQGGFDWVTKGDKKPAATQSTDSAPSTTDSGSATSAGSTPAGATPGATASAPATPPAAVSTSPAADTTAPQGAPAPTSAPQDTSPQTTPAQPSSTPAASTQASPTDPNAPADSASQPADTGSNTQSPQAETPPAAKPRERKPTPAKPVDPVAEAERYIYGNGVRQDCDRGVRLLKPAAEQSNPKAMISMGTIYSTGTCTPRDLPTAYRWFALALHKQPDNQALQDDLQKLWSQMTQPERQLAIKLSQ